MYTLGRTTLGAGTTVSGNTAANGSGVYVYYGDRFVVSPDAAIDDDFYLCDGKKLTYEVTYADGGKPLLVPRTTAPRNPSSSTPSTPTTTPSSWTARVDRTTTTTSPPRP